VCVRGRGREREGVSKKKNMSVCVYERQRGKARETVGVKETKAERETERVTERKGGNRN